MNKIVLIIPTMSSGGAERVMSQLANKWATQGNEVYLILLAKAERFYSIDSNVTIYQLGFENLGGKATKIYYGIRTLFQLRKLLKDLSPDSVLSFMTKYNAFTIIATLGFRLNIFVSDRSNPYKKLSFLIFQLRKLLYPFTKGIIAQTIEAKKVLKEQTGHNNIQVIPNPVREIQLYPENQRENIILNVGRMVTEKGQKYLLRAFSEVQDKKWELVILGDGPLRKELKNEARKLGINERVKMPGFVKNVDEWLSRSSIFVFSSVSEGFPNALLEAMAAGLPCISFDCPVGPSDIINDGYDGFLVELKNVEQLKERLDFLINNATTRKQISENINMNKYKLDCISYKYLGVITS